MRRIPLTGMILLMLLYFSLSHQTASANGAEVVSFGVEEEIQRLVTEGDIPSLHVCVVSGDELNWVRGFGEQTSPDTVFLVGSIQKMFVAVSILQLYENDIIDLYDDINDYLPFAVRNPQHPNISVTIQMLLTHRAGLYSTMSPEFCYDWEGLHYPDYYSRSYYPSVVGISLGEFLYEVLDPDGQYYYASNWINEPGTEYSYSNTGYKILMYLLEVVSNKTIADYMQENIFGPLRMNNTGFYASDYVGHHAIPHSRLGTNTTNTALPIWNGTYMIRSTVSDMGHFMIALMNRCEFDGHKLLEPSTLDEMIANEYRYSGPNLRKELRWEGYGLGQDLFSHGVKGHGGSTVGFTANLYFNPDTKLGVVRLSNVNAILDPSSNEWSTIYEYTSQIVNLVMSDVGLLPLFGIAEVLPVMTFVCVLAVVGFACKRRRKARLVTEANNND
ncbi:MAG: serine hydrolase [Candidatus Thorarchaeota archaeon]|nr:MAG: serine hydrolase [Candidatus Thorarchaeota archaeon]